MPIDTPTLIWCIAVPAGIAILASVVCWILSKRAAHNGGTPSRCHVTLASTILAAAWWLAVALSLRGSDSFALWSEDAWPRMIWPLLGGVFLAPLLSMTTLRNQPGLWIIVGWLAVVAATLAMPSGDAWKDLLPLHRPWIVSITIAVTFNAMALYRMADRNADRWLLLVILAGLACPAIIGAATYGALLQTCLGAIVATLAIAVFAAFGLVSSFSAIILPSVLFTNTMVAAGRFYSYDEVSVWIYGLAMFAPGIIALADRIVVTKSVAIRVAVAGFVATAIVIVMTHRFLIA